LKAKDLIDETFIHFYEGATEGFDKAYDAFQLPGKRLPEMPGMTNEVPQLYSIIPGELLSINILPPSKEHVIVQLGLEPKNATSFSITASELESFNPETRIYLQDTKENVVIDLRETDTYEFTGSSSDRVDRFLLHFSPTKIELKESPFIDVDVWSYDKNIFIDNGQNIQGEVTVYNMMGQKVYHGTLEGNLNTIGMTSQSGYYIVKVINDQNLKTTKVFIK
jgi:hypothetical protein